MTITALLLAEPETEFRDFLERHLRDDGFEVLRASFRSRHSRSPSASARTSSSRPTPTSAAACVRASPAGSGTATYP